MDVRLRLKRGKGAKGQIRAIQPGEQPQEEKVRGSQLPVEQHHHTLREREPRQGQLGGHCPISLTDHHPDRVEEVGRQPLAIRPFQEDRLGPEERAKLPETRQHAQRLQPIESEDPSSICDAPVLVGHLETLRDLPNGRICSRIDQGPTPSEGNLERERDEDLHSQRLDERGR